MQMEYFVNMCLMQVNKCISSVFVSVNCSPFALLMLCSTETAGGAGHFQLMELTLRMF